MTNINIVMRYFEISESSSQEEERLKRAREQGFNVDDPHYHGTPGGDFDEFDPYRTADEDLAYGAGIYMSRDPDAASGYSRPGTSWGNHTDDARPTVYKVYHRVKNPFDMSKFYPYAEVKRIMEHCFTEDELESIPFWQEIQEEVQYSSRTSEEWEELSEYLINLESGGRFDDMPDPDRYEDGEDDPEYIEDEEEARKYEIKSIQKRIQNIEERTAREYEDHKKMVATGRKGSALGKEIYRTLWTNTSEYHDWKAESQLFGGETETFEFKTEANRWLEELGYDGLTHVDRYNPGNKGVSHNVTIAFHPQQVRSAHANFDPEKIDSPKLSESIETGEYYMKEACGIYTMALSLIDPGGKIGIISDDHGEPWSKTIPYEVTHVFYFKDDSFFDVKGIRTIDKMASDFNLSKYSLKGPFEPADFMKKFMGNSDSKPLYGTKAEILKLAKEIRSNAATITESYREEETSTFGDDGVLYRLNDIFKSTEKALAFDIPVSKLTWQIEAEEDEDRTNRADCSVPILVWKKGNRLICVDGMHRLQKAVRLGLKTLPAKYVLDTIMKKARISEAILTEKVWLDDRGFPFGVNPTRREFMGKFERDDGAAGVLMRNGSLAVGNAPSLTHADLAATCGFDSKDIKYHLQIWDVLENGTMSIEVELWDETNGVQRGTSNKFPKAKIDTIKHELESNPNISRLKMPVIVTVRDPDWDIVLRESEKHIDPPTAGEILTLIKNHYRNNDVWTRGDCGTFGLTEVARPNTRVQADAILRNAGYTRLGKGQFGAVYQKTGKPYVLKVFAATDKPYLAFVDLAKAHQDNPHFPKFFGKVVNVTPNVSAIRMEPLAPYKHDYGPIRAYLNWRDHPILGPESIITMQLGDADDLFYEQPGLKEACDLVIDNLFTRYRADIKQDNFMVRGKTIVFIDPVSHIPYIGAIEELPYALPYVEPSKPKPKFDSSDDDLVRRLFADDLLKESYHPEMISNENIKWTKSAKQNAELAANLLRKAGFNAFTENPSGRKTDSRFAAIGSKTNGILVNPRCGYWKDPVAAAQLNFKVGHLSTDHPLGVLLHEIAHIIYDAPDNWFADLHKEVAKRVSKYAASNPKEFVSEVYAGINTGKKYDDEVMKFYNMYARK